MEKLSQCTGPLSGYLREPSLQSPRTVLHDSIMLTNVLYLLVSHCHVTSCPISLVRIPYHIKIVLARHGLCIFSISTGHAQGCTRSLILQSSTRSNGVSIASLSIGLFAHRGFRQFWGNSAGTLSLLISNDFYIYIYNSKFIYIVHGLPLCAVPKSISTWKTKPAALQR